MRKLVAENDEIWWKNDAKKKLFFGFFVKEIFKKTSFPKNVNMLKWYESSSKTRVRQGSPEKEKKENYEKKKNVVPKKRRKTKSEESLKKHEKREPKTMANQCKSGVEKKIKSGEIPGGANGPPPWGPKTP